MNESDKAWLDLCMHHDYKTFCESSASITSYEDMVLKTNNHVNNAKDGCNEENLELPKDMFLNSAGEEIINNEKKWFKKKKNALEAQVTFIERRVIRGLKRSLRQSTDKMRKEYNASLFQYSRLASKVMVLLFKRS